jgi:hypothetical protein
MIANRLSEPPDFIVRRPLPASRTVAVTFYLRGASVQQKDARMMQRRAALPSL